MKYVQRNEAGAIIAAYDNPQVGEAPESEGSTVLVVKDFAPEKLADDDPELLAFERAQRPQVFVRRGADGSIVDINRQPQEGGAEALFADDVDVLAFQLARDRVRSRAEIERARDAALAGSVDFMGRRHHLDPTFQLQLTGMITAFNAGLLAPDARQNIRTFDNEIVSLGLAELKGLAGVVLVRVRAIWEQSWAEKDALGK